MSSTGDTTDTSVRYAAYATRIRTILLSAHRYVAYTSDIGESFRPVAHPYLVRGAYAVSWAYLIGDVTHEGWKAHKRNQRLLSPTTDQHMQALINEGPEKQNITQTPTKIPAIEDWRAVAAQRAVFQSVASMGLPAFTIHSIVRYSGKALKNAKNATVRTWAPIGVSKYAIIGQSGTNEYNSLASQPCLLCLSCSTSQLKRQSNGYSIMVSRLLVVRGQ